MTFYLQTWTDGAQSARRYEGQPLEHGASNQYAKMGIAPGDVLYIAYLDSRRLHLLGRLPVAEILTQAQANAHFGEEVWQADTHVIGVGGDPAAFDLLVEAQVVRELQFEQASGKLTSLAVTDGGRVDGRALQSIRRLTPSSAALLDEILEDEAAPRPPRSKELPSQAAKKAVEQRAMSVARAHYEDDGWEVEDVSMNRPYDFECKRGVEVRHVEVKGLSGPPERIQLTRNEVDHAETCPRVALAVVSGIVVTSGRSPRASGGSLDLTDPWLLDPVRLRPTAFSYRLEAVAARGARVQ